MFWRKDATVPEDSFSSAIDYYKSVRTGMREKANHNKNESQICFTTIILCTLIAPLFVTLGTGIFWSKLVPSLLSVTAGGLTTWLQLRKPQRLWTLYRGAQRELEAHKANYDFKDADFADALNPDQLLARKVTHVARRVHDAWETLVPEPDVFTGERKNEAVDRRNVDDSSGSGDS